MALGLAKGFALFALLLMEFGYLICDIWLLSMCVWVDKTGMRDRIAQESGTKLENGSGGND